MASVDPIELRDHQAIGPIEVSAIEMPHGPIKASGLIFSDGAHKIAYATDFSKFTVEMVDFFQGVDLFVIDALRRYPHPTHPHVDRKSTPSELQSLMRSSYAVFCLKKKKQHN